MAFVVYSACGRQHIKEAAISAWSLKRHSPDSKVFVLANEPVSCKYFDIVEVMGDLLDRPVDWLGKMRKADALLNCPAEECLFVDSDTYFCDAVDEVFQPDVRYDVAAVHDTWQFPEIYQMKSPTGRLPTYSQAQPFFNTGVLFLRKNDKVVEFLHAWRSACESDPNDQLAFADCLYASDIRIHALPSVYNARAAEPIHLSGRLKILHQYSSGPKARRISPVVAAILSETYHNRVYMPHEDRMVAVVPHVGYVESRHGEHDGSCELARFLEPELQFVD